jgi:hypothetical protein
MSEWPESVEDIQDAMYPVQRRWWVEPFWKLYHWGFYWRPFGTGGDEWGWHTIFIIVPLFGEIVVRTNRCDCDEMKEFACPWPACPQLSMMAGGYCTTHDREWVEELLAEVADR